MGQLISGTFKRDSGFKGKVRAGEGAGEVALALALAPGLGAVLPGTALLMAVGFIPAFFVSVWPKVGL
jgi:hypothetical protein